jgi:hypothetical protein
MGGLFGKTIAPVQKEVVILLHTEGGELDGKLAPRP